MEQNTTKVGISILIFKDGKILLGKRKGSHGQSQYAGPGGHLEYMESFESSIKREIKEETGIEIDNIKFLRVLNLKDYAPKHYVDIGLTADWKSGEPQVIEPEKIEGWDWYDIDNLPQPLFGSVPTNIEAFKTGKNYYDA
jgi:8-oxo-dGTP diphosphatase